MADTKRVILPDNDDTGRNHVQTVAPSLVPVATSVRIPDLGGAKDISDWIEAGVTQSDLETLVETTESFTPNPDPFVILLSGANWLTRDIPEPDFIFGELLSTTTRAELIGPTGIGKSNFLLAMGMAAADGRDFLHWRGYGHPRRILFVDGEMSRRLTKLRLTDATRRHGAMPDTFFYFNREDFPNFQPLNTEPGQNLIDQIIDAIGGIDLAILDNTQALLMGDMKDEEPWELTLPWVRSLTQRSIGQIWAHHTGHDETHGYGTKTREWQLDTVSLMERIERPDTDVAFKLSFPKARERAPHNRADFEPAVITLSDDTWMSARGNPARTGRRSATELALDILNDEIARGNGTIPPPNERIPPNTPCITVGAWRKAYEQRTVHENKEAAERSFYRAANKLTETLKTVAKHELWVWPVK